MTVRYVYSGATGNADGTTWADAYTTLAAVAAVDTAGDIIYVSDNHSESTAGAVAPSWAGTVAAPTRIICADDSTGEPPTTLAPTAVVATTGANNLTPSTGAAVVYFYGIRFKAGDSTNGADIVLSRWPLISAAPSGSASSTSMGRSSFFSTARNSAEDLSNQPAVINGFSDLMVSVFGERRRHARSAVGMQALPVNITVEIEMVVEVEDR